MQTRDPRGIQTDTRSDNQGLVSIQHPLVQTHLDQLQNRLRATRFTVPEPRLLVEEIPTVRYLNGTALLFSPNLTTFL